MSTGLDYERLFEAIPTPYLVMSTDLVIVATNAAYLAVVGRSREDLVGRPVFEAFPPMPDAMDPTGVTRVQLSFERARDTGRPDTMPVQKYDIPDPVHGGFVERYWSLISVPIVGPDGRTELLLQRAEDVTDYVHERNRRGEDAQRDEDLRRRTEEAEADLFARSQELRAALEERDVVSRRLAALAEVSLELSDARTVEELTGVVVRRGVAVLGGDGGAVAAVRDDGLRMLVSEGLGVAARDKYAEIPLDGTLPSATVTRTARSVLLPTRRSCEAFSPAMADVVRDTGCVAWAVLPLVARGRVLGSISIGWREEHPFSTSEIEVLDALAAQCAQGLDRIQVREAERRSAEAVRRMSETLQRSLLTEPPQPDHLQIAVRYRPAAQEAQVGGDWYDAFMSPDGSTNLVIGDVAGHDRIAAAAMGQVRNLLRGVAYTLGEPPAAVLSALDRALRDLAVGSLATAVLGRVEQEAGMVPLGLRRFRWSNAGHPPPLLLRADGTAELLRRPADLLLGLDPGTSRADHDVVLEPGDTVLLFSDGLVERREYSIEEGLDRLVRAAEELGEEDLESLLDALLQQAGDRDDDVAMLALRTHRQDAPRPPEAGPEMLPEDLTERRQQLAARAGRA